MLEVHLASTSYRLSRAQHQPACTLRSHVCQEAPHEGVATEHNKHTYHALPPSGTIAGEQSLQPLSAQSVTAPDPSQAALK